MTATGKAPGQPNRATRRAAPPKEGMSKNRTPKGPNLLAKQLEGEVEDLKAKVGTLEEAVRVLLVGHERMERLIATAVAKQMAAAQLPQVQQKLEQEILDRLRSGDMDTG